MGGRNDFQAYGGSTMTTMGGPPPEKRTRSARLPLVPEYAFEYSSAVASSLLSSVGCMRCELGRTRTKVVPGEGDPLADICFIGEGPGEDEDLSGRPFVGRAGAKLTELMKEAGLSREHVFITNVVRCRPPGNRKPEPCEVAACSSYLAETLRTLPKLRVLVLLGASPSVALLKPSGIFKITQERGRWRELVIPSCEDSHRVLKVMPTLHPSYVLRAPAEEHKLFADLQSVSSFIRSTK